MTYDIAFDDELQALVASASGEATVAGFRTYIAAILAHPKWKPGANVLSDFTQLDTRDLTSQNIEQIAEIHIANDERIGPGFHGIATGQPATFGLARMWEAYTDGQLALHTRVFYTVEEARAWMRETGTSTSQVGSALQANKSAR